MSASSPSSSSTSSSRRALPILAVALAAFLAYSGTLRFGFVYDDDLILKNPLMHAPGRILETFTTPFYGPTREDIDLYRPLTAWTFALNWRANEILGLAGSHGAGFHLANVLLHAAASVLVFVWLQALSFSRWIALSAGLLFAVHPIHSEAVANVCGRSEPLAALFGLAFLVYIRRGKPVQAGVAMLAALWSKESALAFLPLAIATDAVVPSAGQRWRPRVYLGALVAVAVFFTMRSVALSGVRDHPVPLENPLATAAASERVLTAARVQLDYVRLCAWPVGLSTDYSYDQIPIVDSVLEPRVLGFAVLVACAGWAAWYARRRRPEITLAVLTWSFLFAATSNFLFPIGTIMGERLAYAPSIGFVLLAGCAFDRLAARAGTFPAAIALGLGAGACAILTVKQSEVWKDALTLFRAQVASAPRSARAHSNLGIVLQQSNDNEGARRSFEESLRIYPESSETWYCLGIALANLRTEVRRVIDAFQQALQFGPMHHDARAALAVTLALRGRKDDARKVAEELARLAPDHPQLPQIAKLLAATVAAPR